MGTRLKIRILNAAAAATLMLAGCTTSRPKGAVTTPIARAPQASSPVAASAPAIVPRETSSLVEVTQLVVPIQESDKPVDRATTSPQNEPSGAVLAQPPELLPPNSLAEDVAKPTEAAPLTDNTIPIDLATALQVAAGQNPQVAYTRQRIQQAFAQMRAADVLWVPSLRAGMNYNKHEGRIQDVAGRMIETSRGSVYTGLGAQAVGAGSPAVPGLLMDFELRDAIFQPRIAERMVGARQQASRAVTNDTLLDTAVAYIDLLEAHQVEAVAKQTEEHAGRLVELTGSFAQTGQGLVSDADRSLAELSVRQIDSNRASEAVQVASVRLARLLSQDPTRQIVPVEPALIPIDLVPLDCVLPELVAIGLSNRPELAESQYLVGAAVERLRSERNAPLLPSVLLGLSYGGNGGGIGSDITNFGDRLDFDAVAFWEIRNLGFGEQAARSEARSGVEQARWRQVQAMDQVASDVAEAYAQVVARKAQIGLAQAGIRAATESYRRNIDRIREAQGLPIETLQAIQAMDQAQRQYVRAVADYNLAQFSLQRALGWPVSGDLSGERGLSPS
ncbi:MAG: TolC family protein [Pirellulales bacterium]